MLEKKARLLELEKTLTTECKRKLVVCVVYAHNDELFHTYNGPNSADIECTNEVGNCGCCHAEARAVVDALRLRIQHAHLLCSYSPCTYCANLIVKSGLFKSTMFLRLNDTDPRGVDILRASGITCEPLP